MVRFLHLRHRGGHHRLPPQEVAGLVRIEGDADIAQHVVIIGFEPGDGVVMGASEAAHTDDADAGEDKMEKMAKAQAQSIWDIAEHYKQAYWADVRALNIRQPAQWTVATDYVPQMIEFAKGIAEKHCYELDSGLYFDVSTVADYGRLARAATSCSCARASSPAPGATAGATTPADPHRG